MVWHTICWGGDPEENWERTQGKWLHFWLTTTAWEHCSNSYHWQEKYRTTQYNNNKNSSNVGSSHSVESVAKLSCLPDLLSGCQITPIAVNECKLPPRLLRLGDCQITSIVVRPGNKLKIIFIAHLNAVGLSTLPDYTCVIPFSSCMFSP